jgi:hypothetical protein
VCEFSKKLKRVSGLILSYQSPYLIYPRDLETYNLLLKLSIKENSGNKIARNFHRGFFKKELWLFPFYIKVVLGCIIVAVSKC